MNIQISKESPRLVKNLTILDGHTRSGKFFLGKIVSGLNNVEFFQYSFTLDYIPYMARLGAITEDGAISLLRSIVDQSCFNQTIGRNLNIRSYDRSSILNAPNHEEYLKRSKSEFEIENVLEFLSEKNRCFVFVLHNNLANAQIMFKAFPDLKIIHIMRNPIDLVYSWIKKDYFKAELKNNIDQCLTQVHSQKPKNLIR